jgi:hypothetical protein
MCNIVWNQKVHYRVYSSWLFAPILSQFNPVHPLTSYLRFILILSYTYVSVVKRVSFLYLSPPKPFAFPVSHWCTCPTRLIICPWLTRIFVKQFKSVAERVTASNMAVRLLHAPAVSSHFPRSRKPRVTDSKRCEERPRAARQSQVVQTFLCVWGISCVIWLFGHVTVIEWLRNKWCITAWFVSSAGAETREEVFDNETKQRRCVAADGNRRRASADSSSSDQLRAWLSNLQISERWDSSLRISMLRGGMVARFPAGMRGCSVLPNVQTGHAAAPSLLFGG